MRRCLTFALLMVLVKLVHAEPSAQQFPSLSGTVVKQPGDQPLKKVLLHLIADPSQDATHYTTETDSEGHFSFERVQPGRYRLLLEKTGFHAINVRGRRSDGPVLTLDQGQDVKDQIFEMLQSAVITGKVVDEDGEPLPYFGISLMKRKPGKSQRLELVAEERTNDLGEYRFAGLFPGTYYVAVVPPPDVRSFSRTIETPEPSGRPDLSYVPTYYPGTTDGTQAAPIDLRAGSEMPLNFTMIPSNTYLIRGSVIGIPAKEKAIIQLVSRGVIQTINGAELRSDGQFEIRGIAPGSYFVTAFAGAEGQTLTAREPVKIVAADVEGVKLVPIRPFNVSGHVQFEGFSPKNISHCSLYLRPAADTDDEPIPALNVGATTHLDSSGNFQFGGLIPGTYRVQFIDDVTPNTFVKSVVVGRNTFASGFALTGPASVEIVVSANGGVLAGAVAEKDQPQAGVTVVAVPEQAYRTIDERYGTATTDQRGRFTIRGLAPGSYTVFAWQDLDDGIYSDPDFLRSQDANGTSIQVGPGSHNRLELKLSPVGDEWR